jgi:hypothetical protein
MGVWWRPGVGRGRFREGWSEVRAADDAGLSPAWAAEGMIEDCSVMSRRRRAGTSAW